MTASNIAEPSKTSSAFPVRPLPTPEKEGARHEADRHGGTRTLPDRGQEVGAARLFEIGQQYYDQERYFQPLSERYQQRLRHRALPSGGYATY